MLKPSGINIFSAVRYVTILFSTHVSLSSLPCSLTIQQRLQSKSLSAKDKGALNSLSKKLTSHAAKLGLDMSQKKPRGRKPVASCLHSAGICVPVNTQLDIGYRPLPMTNSRYLSLIYFYSFLFQESLLSCSTRFLHFLIHQLNEIKQVNLSKK